LSNTSWQKPEESTFIFSVCAPDGAGGYAGQVNRILDEIAKIIDGKEVIIAGDFNLSISYWVGS